MIDLYLSTSKKITSERLLDELVKNEVECQIYDNVSSMRSCGKPYKEKGFYLKLSSSVTDETFREKVWDCLVKLLDIKCAYVKYEDKYMGCVMNWPGVFVESKCELPE